jgi:hypothetical protein
MTEWKRLTVCLTPEEYQELRVYAALRGMNMSAITRAILLNRIREEKDRVTFESPKKP